MDETAGEWNAGGGRYGQLQIDESVEFEEGAPALSDQHDQQPPAASKPASPAPPLRMKQLQLEDYYSAEDKARDIEKISLFFKTIKTSDKTLDGAKMIDRFVKPNLMTQWHLPKHVKRSRAAVVNQSYERLIEAQKKLKNVPLDQNPLD